MIRTPAFVEELISRTGYAIPQFPNFYASKLIKILHFWLDLDRFRAINYVNLTCLIILKLVKFLPLVPNFHSLAVEFVAQKFSEYCHRFLISKMPSI